MAAKGFKPPSVDRNTILSALSEAWGARAWMICDIPTKTINRVSVCLSPRPPFDPIDCPWGLSRPSKYEKDCDGQLVFPITNALSLTSPCTQYIPKTYETAAAVTPAPVPLVSPAPASPETSPSPAPNSQQNSVESTPVDGSGSGSSSSNIGAIVGGVVGGLAAVAMIVAGLLLLKRRQRQQSANASTSTAEIPSFVAPPTAPTSFSIPNQAHIQQATDSGGEAGPYAHQFASSPPPMYPPPPAPAVGGSSGNATTAAPAAGAAAAALPVASENPQIWQQPGVISVPDPLLAYINSTQSNRSSVGSGSTSRGPLAAWQLNFADLVIQYPIGEGSWGRVYKASWNQAPVAVKILMDGGSGPVASISANQSTASLMTADSPVFARLNQEASIMTQLHHPSIVQFFGITLFPAAVVTEFCERGSLTAVLQLAGTSPERAAELTWSRRISLAADCVRGMLFLHSRSPPIVHRDLKSPNLLVTAAWACKVSDFNLSKILEESTQATSMQCMNPRWLPPEVLRGEGASLAGDVYAFGVIMWELLTWQLPWGTANGWTIVGALNSGAQLPIPPPNELPGVGSGEWPQLGKYVELMKWCWSQDAAERPVFSEIMGELIRIDPQLA